MISDMPCSARSVKATGTSSRIGQRISPPGYEEYSLISYELTRDGQLYHAMISDAGNSATRPPMISTHACTRRGYLPKRTSMRTCSLRLSVHAATSMNTAALRYHCASSQALELMLTV